MWAIMALLSAVFAALTSILAKVGIEGVNSNLATAVRTVVVVLMAWGMVFITDTQSGLGEISRRSWLFLILSGLATGASWLCYYRALQKAVRHRDLQILSRHFPPILHGNAGKYSKYSPAFPFCLYEKCLT